MTSVFELHELAHSGARMIGRLADTARSEGVRRRYLRISEAIAQLANERQAAEQRTRREPEVVRVDPTYAEILQAARTELEVVVRTMLAEDLERRRAKDKPHAEPVKISKVRIRSGIDIDAAIERAYLAQRAKGSTP